jgi:hypothetical protein
MLNGKRRDDSWLDDEGRLGKLFQAEPPLEGAGITQRVASTHTANFTDYVPS